MGDILSGAIVAGLFALVAYFLNRLIDQYDGFRKETKSSFTEIRGKLAEVERTSVQNNNLAVKLNRDLPPVAPRGTTVKTSGIDKETKAQILQIKSEVSEIKKEMSSQVIPALKKVEKNHGKIIWIKESLETQDKKMLGLFKIMKSVIEEKKKP